MSKYTLVLASCMTLLPSIALANNNSACEIRLNELNERASARYINLDSQCYPEGTAVSCGAVLSEECQAQYDALSKQSATEFDAFIAECPDYLMSTSVGTDLEAPEIVTKAPSKKEMLRDIKTLKGSLRRANKKIKSLRLKVDCR